LVRIFAVLPEVGLGTFRESLRRCSLRAAKVEYSETLLEAIQKMYLLGPPDLLVTHELIAGSSLDATIQGLRGQPGFETMKVALVSPGCDTPREGAGHLRLLPFPTSVGNWLEFLSTAFPEDFMPPAPPAEEHPRPTPPPQREESRKALRRNMAAPCVVWTGALKHSGKLKDISLSGARVFVDVELPLSAHATLSVAVPGTLPMKVIQFKALVVRWEPGGYGLQFKEMDQDTRHFLKHYTEGKVLDDA
jgi:hypothetical protein